MNGIKNLCVYCGSRVGTNGRYEALAREFGNIMAEAGVGLVFGGGSIGLMGTIARAILERDGNVIGIIPEHLHKVEVAFEELPDLRIVNSMHERKKLMFDLSDGFVILPGGLGTLDETFEIITWAQLGLHNKPVILVNEEGYWNPFLDLCDHVIDSGFASPASRDLFYVVNHVADVLGAIEDHMAPQPRAKSALF